MTAEPCRAKAKPFTPSSILVRPHQMPPRRLPQLDPTCLPLRIYIGRRHLVEAPGTAPGSDRLITAAFIAIAGRIQQSEYRGRCTRKKACLARDMCSHAVTRCAWKPPAAAGADRIRRIRQEYASLCALRRRGIGRARDSSPARAGRGGSVSCQFHRMISTHGRRGRRTFRRRAGRRGRYCRRARPFLPVPPSLRFSPHRASPRSSA